MLRPGGVLALVWNPRDERIPWVRRLGRIVGTQDQPIDESAQPLVLSSLFGFVEEATFRLWQEINRETVLDLALSLSTVASLDERRARGQARRGARVVRRVRPRARRHAAARTTPAASGPSSTTGAETGTADDEETSSDEPPQDGPDDMQLIDFR